MNILDIVKDRTTKFHEYMDNALWYVVEFDDNRKFTYPIPIEDAKGGRFLAKDKAILHMRWIRKQLSEISSI